MYTTIIFVCRRCNSSYKLCYYFVLQDQSDSSLFNAHITTHLISQCIVRIMVYILRIISCFKNFPAHLHLHKSGQYLDRLSLKLYFMCRFRCINVVVNVYRGVYLYLVSILIFCKNITLICTLHVGRVDYTIFCKRNFRPTRV